jgi:hypothetical protein
MDLKKCKYYVIDEVLGIVNLSEQFLHNKNDCSTM